MQFSRKRLHSVSQQGHREPQDTWCGLVGTHHGQLPCLVGSDPI